MTVEKSKGRLLFLEQYLNEHTDEEHMLTADELIAVCVRNGYKTNRNTLRDDIAILQDHGIDVIVDHIGKFSTFYIGGRLFEPAEIKTLIDAVSSSRFITKDKSESLIKKLTMLTSKYGREHLIESSFSTNMIKTNSIGIFRTIDIVNTAIREGKKIIFQYIDYLPTKKKVLKHDGKWYRVSPQALLWNDDRYYAPSYDEEKARIIPYRIDRMKNVEVSDEPAVRDYSFNSSEYSRTVLKMYDGDREEQEITLAAKNQYMLNIIDRFGEEVETEIIDEYHFRAKVTVRPSSTFYSWVFQFRGDVIISAPDSVKLEYLAMLDKVITAQK